MDPVVTTLLIAFLAAVNAGLVGAFLVLRQQVMVGDAISHAVLPGIVVAFCVSGSTHVGVMLGGAMIAGVLAGFFITWLREQLHLSPGAAIGIGVSGFFGSGLVLLALYADNVDLDQGCVLYGELVTAYLKRWVYMGMDMGAFYLYVLGGLVCFNVVWIMVCYPTLVFTSFDPAFATTVGVRVRGWYYSIMLVTAMTIVFLFRIVGAPLLIGFLVLPPATAYLCSQRVSTMLMYTVMVDAIITCYGYLLANGMNASLNGCMVVASAVLFAVIFFLTGNKGNRSVVA